MISHCIERGISSGDRGQLVFSIVKPRVNAIIKLCESNYFAGCAFIAFIPTYVLQSLHWKDSSCVSKHHSGKINNSIKGDYTMSDRSRQETTTNINSNNMSHNALIDSYNDNSKEIGEKFQLFILV